MLVQIKHRLRLILSPIPSIIVPYYKFKLGKDNEQPVSRKSDILIEGAGGSGNSFFTATFKWSQKHPIRVSGHTHAAGQVILAVRLRVPVFILIRDPRDAVISLASRPSNTSYKEVNGILKRSLENYINFYEHILCFQEDFVVGNFNEATKNFGAQVEAINKRFKTKFTVFNHSDETMLKYFGNTKFEADPERAKRKVRTKGILENSKNLKNLIARSYIIHGKISKLGIR